MSHNSDIVMATILEDMRKIDHKDLTQLAMDLLGHLEVEFKKRGIEPNNGVMAGTVIYFTSAVLSFLLHDVGDDTREAFEEAFMDMFKVGVAIKPPKEGEKKEKTPPPEWNQFFNKGES